ncbi:hypothetical protein M0R45_019444 [Rubus argutus]|uniref:Uncharacterized protein n=1 Tax=Rubus argutus TaxID=59490 RepID=A0AAW1X640_RUBAR
MMLCRLCFSPAPPPHTANLGSISKAARAAPLQPAITKISAAADSFLPNPSSLPSPLSKPSMLLLLPRRRFLPSCSPPPAICSGSQSPSLKPNHSPAIKSAQRRQASLRRQASPPPAHRRPPPSQAHGGPNPHIPSRAFLFCAHPPPSPSPARASPARASSSNAVLPYVIAPPHRPRTFLTPCRSLQPRRHRRSHRSLPTRVRVSVLTPPCQIVAAHPVRAAKHSDLLPRPSHRHTLPFSPPPTQLLASPVLPAIQASPPRR